MCVCVIESIERPGEYSVWSEPQQRTARFIHWPPGNRKLCGNIYQSLLCHVMLLFFVTSILCTYFLAAFTLTKLSCQFISSVIIVIIII